MKKTKEHKGITLVALIITIVVLLIIAVVSVETIKDSDIIGHAQNATESYKVAEEKEAIAFALSAWSLEEINSTKTFKQVITEELGERVTSVEGPDDGPLTVKFKNTGNTYPITKNENSEPPKQNPTEVGVEIIPWTISKEQAILYIRINGSKVISEQEAVNYVNKKMLGSDEVITLEELDVRLYNKGIEDGKYTGEKAESFEDLKDLIGKEENIEFGNDPANEIFLILQGLYSNEAITNISDAVCCYKYASTSAGGMGETLEYKLTYNKNNGEFKEPEYKQFQGWGYDEKNNMFPGVYILILVEGDGEYNIKLEIGENLLKAATNVKYVEPIEGRYVKYDSNEDGNLGDEILYRILYLDDDKNLGEGQSAHIITDDVLMQNEVYLGYNDDTIPENIPNVGGTTDFNKAVYSYNNLFDTLNNKCKEALDAIAGDGDASVEGITQRFRNPSADPLRTEDLSSYIVVNNADNFFAKFNNKIKKADWDSGTLYNTHQGCDFSRIKSIDIENTPSKANYWLSHRECYTMSWYKYLDNAYVNGADGTSGRAKLFEITNGTGAKAENVSPCGVRPIVVLEYGVLKKAIDNNQGTGTKDDPYILTKINK